MYALQDSALPVRDIGLYPAFLQYIPASTIWCPRTTISLGWSHLSHSALQALAHNEFRVLCALTAEPRCSLAVTAAVWFTVAGEHGAQGTLAFLNTAC